MDPSGAMTEMSRPVFSVIIPTCNRRGLLKTAVDSVLAQSCREFELIVVDDGSGDGTARMLAGYRDPRLVVLRQENRGVAVARNRGLKEARGEWIAFLDSDDRWVPEKLERVRREIKEAPDIRIFHTEEKWYRRGVLLNPKKKHAKPDGDVYGRALALCCLSMSTAVLHREVFESVGVFDEDFSVCEDYDFWLRATHRYRVRLIPKALTLTDGGRPDQLTSNVWGLDRYRIRALKKMLLSGGLSAEEYRRTYRELAGKVRVYSRGARKRGKEEEARRYETLLRDLAPEEGTPNGLTFLRAVV